MAEYEPDEGDRPVPGEQGVLARRIKWLFDHKLKPDGKRYSYREVVRAAGELGIDISPGYISRLVNGLAENPTMDVLTVLGKVFGVEFSYFDPNEPAEEEQARIELAEALRKHGVESIAMRSVGLPPKGIDMVLSMIDRVRELEGLPPVEEPPGGNT